MEDPRRVCSGVDNLSRLQDELLSRILSLLCTEDAVRTSLLSTRWRYLYTSISNLDLDFNSEVLKVTDELDCMNFVDRFLFHREKCALDKFKLKWKMWQALNPLRLENWIELVLGHGIRELDLCIYDFELKYLLLPSILFTSKTLEVLKLSVRLRSNFSSTESKARGYDLELPAKVFLPSLKSVQLKNVGFLEDSWSKLFSNCPILEEFLFSCSQGRGDSKLVISSPTLKRLTVDLKSGCFDVVVDAPSLVYLGFSIGYIKSLKLVNAQSLVETNIGIFRGGPEISRFIKGAHELMRGIRNIQKLRIGAAILTGFKYYNVPIPMLHNMTHLTIYDCFLGLAARGYELPPKVCLPSLRIIHLNNVRFSEDSWSKLFSNCPILEEILFDFSWVRDNFKLVVSSSTLKRLTVDLKSGFFDVIVDAPSLVYLEFSISYIKSFKFVNAQSLVEANIGVVRYGGELSSFINVGSELMRGIRNIQTLRIGAAILESFRICNISTPMLHNMTHLTIYRWDYGWAILPYILEKCESLKTFVLEDLCEWNSDIGNRADESSRISCLTSSLKTIKVGRFTGEEHEVELVKYFLKTTKVLELIEIRLDSKCRNPSEITTELQMLPKISEALMNIIV